MSRRDGEALEDARIVLWWIGEAPGDARILERVRLHVAAEFRCAVALEAPGTWPPDTYDERRKQHSSRAMLRWLIEQAPARDGRRLLGITDVDLFIPVLTFVFGEAQLEGPAAVVSMARLTDESPEVTIGRLAREAVHELGHTFGLRHCGNAEGGGWRARSCVMARSPSVRAVDAKGLRLCGDCRERYRLVQQDGSHVYREHENPHR